MALDIANTIRSRSIITLTGNTATRINLSQLSSNTSLETVTAASISSAFSSSDGTWNVYRGNDATGTLTLQLTGQNYLPLVQSDISLANNSSSNVYITNTGTVGTLILQLSKTASYSSNLDNI